MKRQFTILLFIICYVTYSSAQYDIVDFEPAGYGNAFSWTMDQNGTNPAITLPSNPVSGGINTSATVAQFDAQLAGQQWALCYTSSIEEFIFDATNSTIKIKVYKTVTSDVAIKFEGSSAAIELKVANTVTDAWEELTFDFSGSIGNTYNKLVIIPDFAARAADHTLYFDDIQIPDGNVAATPEPTTAATTPTHTVLADNVISIYSDAYTDIANTEYNPSWSQSTVVTYETVASDNVLKYSSLNYQGTNIGSSGGTTPQDFSGHGYFHVDFWTPNSTSLEFYLIDNNGVEKKVDLTITTEQWVSEDIPLWQFSSQGIDLSIVKQFKVVGNGIVWFDNWYFHSTFFDPSVLSTAAPTPTHDEVSDNVFSIFSDAYTNLANTDFDPNWGQATDATQTTIASNNTLKYAGLNYQGTHLGSSIGADQDVSGYTYLHIDLWSYDATAVEFYLISRTTGEKKYDFVMNNGNWVSVDIPLTVYSGQGLTLTDIYQFKVAGNGTVYFDNWYFHSGTPLPVELSSFIAEASEVTNVLKWETASEQNNSHFNIERSINGIEFETIGTVNGNGTTNEVSSYEFIDENPNQLSYYRLNQVDFNETSELSNVVSVNRGKTTNNNIKLYPNPVSNGLTIDYSSTLTEKVSVTITDVAGRVIYTQQNNAIEGSNQFNLDLSALAKGSYFIRLESNSSTSIQTIIKQ